MDKTKKILIGILILGLISVTIILILISNLKDMIEEDNYIQESPEGDITNIEYDKIILNNSTNFYTIENCINIYIEKIKNNDTKVLYDILNNRYIKENDINTNNILSYVDKVKPDESFIATKIYEIRRDSFYTYIVEGINNLQNTNMYFSVGFDINNQTYNIEPLFSKRYNDIDQIQVDALNTEIAINDNNTYKYYRIKDGQLVLKYFDYYKNLLQKGNSKSYELLDEEYRNKRFGNIDTFKNYINQNKEKILNIEFEKYAKYKYEDYTQYICIDKNGNYYIFNETATMQYKVLLDIYTIDQPEMIKKYEDASESDKAGYNINKFMQAINAKDYNYAYNCLANSFKQNKFPSLENFENYIKNNFFENNNIEYTNGREEGNYYIYNLNITNKNNNSQIIQKDFIMNLKENMEFEMSFEM